MIADSGIPSRVKNEWDHRIMNRVLIVIVDDRQNMARELECSRY